MQINRKTLLQMRAASVVFVLLLLVVLVLLQWLSQSYHWRIDLTQSGRNSLSAASIAVAKQLSAPVTVTIFVGKSGTLRDDIRKRFLAYQKHKSDIHLEFVDPDINPDRVIRAGIRRGSEVRIRYKKATESLPLSRLTEERITNALARLDHRGKRLLVFLAGHGERRPDQHDKSDISQWAEQLKKSGYKTYVQFLNEHPRIPDNTAILIIASPKKTVLKREVQEIRNFISKGGNVLWLMEPGGLRGMDRIAEYLDIEFHPGMIIDLNAALVTGSVYQIAISQYGKHPVVRGFRERTRFYHARAISLAEKSDWKQRRLLSTPATSWTEVGPLSKRVRFNRGVDIPGPLQLAVSLSRARGNQQQRIIIVGDGDFLSNRMLALDYNLDLAMAMIHWLGHNDAYIQIPTKITRDRQLNLPRYWIMILSVVFIFIIPLGLIAGGTFVWLRRRRR